MKFLLEKRAYILIGISVCFIAAIVFFNKNPFNNEETIVKIEIPNNIDYYLKNTKQKSFKSDGSIDFTLNSDLLKHFKKEDKSTLLKPDVLVRRTSSWRISALNGAIFHPTEIIRFKQNVLLDKQASNETFQVSSQALLFNIQQDLVISESDVKVNSDSWTLNAKKMTLDMNSEVHQFSQVTARYRHDKKS